MKNKNFDVFITIQIQNGYCYINATIKTTFSWNLKMTENTFQDKKV